MALNCATPQDVLKTIKDKNVQMVDLRFTDLPGVWQHFSVPPSAIDADTLEEGIGFDGSSIRGFQEIQESDMLVVPDPTTAFLDPFTTATTLVLICNVRDPVTGQAATLATSPKRPKPTSRVPASAMQPISARRRSFSSSTRCAMGRA
jgi:glutamine synthetase